MKLNRLRSALIRRVRRARIALAWPKKLLFAEGLLPVRSLLLPHFMIIGMPKAGTTWLHRHLALHPGLFLAQRVAPASDPTEIRYFDRDFHRSLRFYSRYFETAGTRLRGEKTPAYHALPESRIRFMKRLMPDLRLVIFLRNPIERAWSHALMNLVRFEGRPFETITEADWLHHFQIRSASGRYSEILARWEGVFSKDAMFIGFFEDIANRPAELLAEVFSFLGVDPAFDLPDLTRLAKVNPGPARALPAHLRAHLEAMYGDEIETLYRRFGERVASWRVAPSAP